MGEIETLTAALTGRYAIEREIGAGGMATVYLAHDLRHDRRVALKLLRPELGALLGAERFLAEIKVTANLQHPNLLPLFDSGEVNGMLFYVMPYIEGEALRARLDREKQLPVDEALRIAVAVATALEYAHSRRVIHRDLKPENILLSERRSSDVAISDSHAASQASVLVADFGIARTLDEAGERLTQTGLALGTAACMSPEQATGERSIDERSDIYALGCVLYEMLAGEPPFTGPNPRVILSKQLSDPVRPVRRVRSAVSPRFDAVLARALARAPADRFQSARAFAEALEGIGTDGTSGKSGAGGLGLLARLGRREVVGGVLVVLAAVATSVVVTRRGNGDVPIALRLERFTPATTDTGSAYLASALEQDVARSLAGTGQVRVFRTAAKEVRSDFVLSATTHRIADSVRLGLSLTRSSTGEVFWAANVTTSADRVSELAEEGASAVLVSLGRPRLGARAAAPTRDSIAYDRYLRARFLADRRTLTATTRSIALFHEAIARDSAFADAWAGLARELEFANIFRYDIPGLPHDSLVPQMVAASERALEADSGRAYVWVARAYVLREVEPASRRGALDALARAVAIDSNLADAWFYTGQTLEEDSQPARALAAFRRAVRVDPTHRQALGFLTLHYLWARQYDSAAAWADSGVRVDPAHILIRQSSATAHLLRGETRLAEDDFNAALRLGQGPDEVHAWTGLAALAWRRGDHHAADTLLAHAIVKADTVHPTLHDAAYLGWGYAEIGDLKRAIRILERFEPRRDLHFQLHLRRDPLLDPLRAQPRFAALLSAPERR